MIEIGEIRRRLLLTMDAAKKAAASHRAEADAAGRAFASFETAVAGPLFRAFAQVLKAQGFLFSVLTPPGAVRLVSQRTADDFIAIELDTARRPVALMGRTSRSRGHRVLEDERVLHEGAELGNFDEEALLSFLLEAVAPFVER